MSSLVELDRPAPPEFKGNKAKFLVDIPFTKTVPDDEKARSAGDLILRGYASTWVEDRDGEYVDPEAFERSLPPYLAKNPIVLWQHDQDKPIGNMTAAFVDQNGLNVEVTIPKPDTHEEAWNHTAYNKIKSGVVKTFSIGGFFEREFVMGRAVIKTVELMEVSVVSIPSNPDSIFEAAAKAVKNTSTRPQLLQEHIKQMKQLLGVDEITDPELVLMLPAERVERYELLADAYRKSGKAAPALDEWRTLEPELETIGTREQALGLTDRVLALVKKINGGVAETKGGRILSRQNEGKLRDVRSHLDSMAEKVDAMAEDAKALLEQTKNELDVVLKQVEEDEAPTAEPSEQPEAGEGEGDPEE